MLRETRAAGYRVELHYVWLRSATLAVKRVRQRVRKGGHAVPEEDVRRRYERSIDLLLSDYLPLADRWFIWDNRERPPQELAASHLHDLAFAEKLLKDV
jgi:predicted ABC-type ATPase